MSNHESQDPAIWFKCRSVDEYIQSKKGLTIARRALNESGNKELNSAVDVFILMTFAKKKYLGESIRIRRCRMKFSRREAAKKLGVSTNFLSAIENGGGGIYSPGAKLTQKIRALLHI
jgi:DNA-binding XRE family transcriptional regulator